MGLPTNLRGGLRNQLAGGMRIAGEDLADSAARGHLQPAASIREWRSMAIFSSSPVNKVLRRAI